MMTMHWMQGAALVAMLAVPAGALAGAETGNGAPFPAAGDEKGGGGMDMSTMMPKPGQEMAVIASRPDGKSFTSVGTGADETGNIRSSTVIETIGDKDHRGFTSWHGTDTSGPPSMIMEYVGAAAPAVIKSKTKSNQSND